MSKAEKILTFLKVAGPSAGFGAFMQDKYNQQQNHKVDINLKNIAVDQAQLDLNQRQNENFLKKIDLYEQSNPRINNIKDEHIKKQFSSDLEKTLFGFSSTNMLDNNLNTQLTGETKTEEYPNKLFADDL